MRTTRKQVEAVFALLATATGHRVATAWNDVGGWTLDYAACYGGYVIHEVSNVHGGVRTPMGDVRRPAGEMFSAMHFALRALEAKDGA